MFKGILMISLDSGSGGRRSDTVSGGWYNWGGAEWWPW